MGALTQLLIANFRRLQGASGTQAAFGERLGLSQSEVSKFAAGRRGWETLRRLEERLEAAGIDPLELVAGVGDGLNAEERGLVARMRALSDRDRRLVLGLLEELEAQPGTLERPTQER